MLLTPWYTHAGTTANNSICSIQQINNMTCDVQSFVLHFRPLYSCCGATGATRG